MTALLGTARELAARKNQWHGTAMLIGQPSEETIDGARAMLADRLYERFGKPDYVLGEHDDSSIAAGNVAIKDGPLLASSTSVDVTMRGIGSHGAHPDAGKDPIVMAAEFILLAQTIVSRQTPPQEPAVLTVGMIHGGLKRNIIPEEVKMELTLRAYSEPVRLNLIEGIKRTANGVAVAYGVPADRMPIVTVSETEVTPPTINDAAFAARLRAVAVATLGADHVVSARAEMGSEDFGLFSLGGTIPSVFVRLGAVEPAKLAESQKTGVPLPGPHSPLFAPVFEPTLRTGVITMTALALDILK
jgi:hippurate hydrolase